MRGGERGRRWGGKREKEKRITGQEQGEGGGKGYIDRGRNRKEGET
jgi:hypothetical protein